MTKRSDGRNPSLTILLIGISLFLWCYLFRLFLNGNAALQGDAYAYLGHFRFYLENIIRGVYPLWDPLENHGNVNEFFLRRIGEFNPLFWTIIFLNKSGLPFFIAYRLFLAGYFFLGIAGFYLLCRRLFWDHLASFSATLLLLFSCIGASIFESYLIFEIVPFIWFSYFLVAFLQTPQRALLLGGTFSLMIINITYIPFYFYTILLGFLICFSGVYFSHIGTVYQQIKNFICRHKIFTCICILLLAFSFIPGLSWYQQTNQAEVSTMERHIGSPETNSATLSIQKIDEGGILPYFIFDRQFINLDKVGLHNFYVPLFAFLMLIAGSWGRLNRRLVALFIVGFTFFLIGLADASYIHGFLYKFIPFFKYFRNVQFFLQFVILPVFILFVVEQMQIFIKDCKKNSLNRKWMTLWVTLVHVCATGLFLYNHVGGITYIVIILSLGWMLGHIWSIGNPRIWTLLLWGAIVLQPFEVYSHIAINYPVSHQWAYDKEYNVQLPTMQEVQKLRNLKKWPMSSTDIPQKNLPYFGTRWLFEARESVNNAILENYLSAPFILYDRTQQVNDSFDLDRLQSSLAHFKDLAYVYSNTKQEAEGLGEPQARIITSTDKDFKVLKFDANDVIVRTSFSSPYFLVRTQNYHSQWKAFIDGKSASLQRTNICIQGLWVPAGDHLVHWHYGATLSYLRAYFLLVLYPFVLGWLICLLLI